ncbi:MAG: hypothetical protein IJ035_07380 [Oscillospiraceae bacterium]|nr:hypothetical protein [Oscillospiraceae bacterium]
MKNNSLTKKITALLASAMILSAMPFTAFAEEAPAETSTTEIAVPFDDEVGYQTTRALKEGDKYAITKLIFKEGKDGLMPGGYTCTQIDEINQQALLTNGKSRIVVIAQNYKEDMQELETFADSVCAMLRIRNITSACDTLFGEPYESEVAGYKAIVYDYDIIQYEFLDETTKQQIDTFKGRNYYFYSDNDVYALMFDTNDEDWEEQAKCFEEFVDAIEIEGAKNTSDGNVIPVVIAVVAIVAVVGAAAVVAVKSKKKS